MTSTRDLTRPLQYVEAVKAGRYDEAYRLAAGLYAEHRMNPVYMVELAAIEYFRGNYQQSFQICTEALPLAPEASLLHVCIGVSAMYLPQQGGRAIQAFQRAVQLMHSKTSTLLIDRSRLPTAGLITPNGEIHSVVFSVARDTVEGNLMQAYRIHQQPVQCLQWCTQLYDLPPVAYGGAYILVLALVDWSPERLPQLDALEQTLRARGQLQLPPQRSLQAEIRRVQRTAEHIINPANECLNGLEVSSIYDDALEAMTRTIFSSEAAAAAQAAAAAGTAAPQLQPRSLQEPQLQRTEKSLRQETNDELRLLQGFQRPEPGRGVALIAQYFRASHPLVQADIDRVLSMNLLNDVISDVHLLNEERFDFSLFPRAERKLHQHLVPGRLTFAEAVRFANQHLRGRVVIIGEPRS